MLVSVLGGLAFLTLIPALCKPSKGGSACAGGQGSQHVGLSSLLPSAQVAGSRSLQGWVLAAACRVGPQGPDARCAFTWPRPGAGHRLAWVSRACLCEEAGVYLPPPQAFPVNWNSFMLTKLTRSSVKPWPFCFWAWLKFWRSYLFFYTKILHLGWDWKTWKSKEGKKIPRNHPAAHVTLDSVLLCAPQELFLSTWRCPWRLETSAGRHIIKNVLFSLWRNRRMSCVQTLYMRSSYL